MIDSEDLLLFAGVVLILIVAFHAGLWVGLGVLGLCLLAAGHIMGKIKSRLPGGRK